MATRELAMNSHHFGMALAYLVNPVNYAQGLAFGSCFIAELWIDFGIIGVVFGGFLYGVLMGRFVPWLRTGNPFVAAFSLAAAMQLIYAPRAPFIGFLSPTLSMVTLAVYLAIHLIAKNTPSHPR